jgi:hypothetical protein
MFATVFLIFYSVPIKYNIYYDYLDTHYNNAYHYFMMWLLEIMELKMHE